MKTFFRKSVAAFFSVIVMASRQGWRKPPNGGVKSSYRQTARRDVRRCLCALAEVFAKQKLLYLITAGTLLLSTCGNPFATEEGAKSSFVVTIGASGNSRSALDYPPNGVTGAPAGAPNLADLKFQVTFTPIPTATPVTFDKQGTVSIKGTLDQGDYTVTTKVLLSDGTTLYAQGCAIDNPVRIGSGSNPITVWVYSVDDAAMPLISVKPEDAAYPVGTTATPLTVSASATDGGTITYQWHSNTIASETGWSNVGTNSPSFTPPTATAGTTYYYVEVTNTSIGSPTTITCGPARVDVNTNAATPTIATPSLSSPTTHIGETVTVSVTASVTDSGVLSYQWYSNTTGTISVGDTEITGATSASYTRPATWAALTETFYYYAIVTNTNSAAPGNKTATATSSVATVTVSPGAGTSGDPFLVHDPDSLQRIGKGTNAAWTGNWSLSVYYEQVRDIDLSTVPNWTPIGTSSNAFLGSYDGGGHTIKNLTINNPSADDQGLFGHTNGNTVIVKNVGLVDCNITGNYDVGGVVGYNHNSSGKIQNCYATGTVSGSSYVGGVAGLNGGTVQYCYATCNVSGTGQVGGVVGLNVVGTVQYCYATGTVSGSSYVGGVVGESNGGTVLNCVALNPNVSGSSRVGRVRGDGSGTLTNNYGRKEMKKNNSYTPGTTWTSNTTTGTDGADIEAAQWGDESWWQAQGFTTANWDFTGIDATHLPKLIGPGGAQNPTVQ